MKRIRIVLSMVLVCIMLIPSIVFADTAIKIPDVFKSTPASKTLPQVELKEFEMEPAKEMPPLNLDGTEQKHNERRL